MRREKGTVCWQISGKGAINDLLKALVDIYSVCEPLGKRWATSSPMWSCTERGTPEVSDYCQIMDELTYIATASKERM